MASLGSWRLLGRLPFLLVCSLTPLFGQRVPGKQLLMTLVILLGIILIQIPYFGSGLGSGVSVLVS